MAGRVLQFLAWLATQIWRFGVKVVNAVSNWVRRNWKVVLRWLEAGASFVWIVNEVKRLLGL